MNILPNTLQNCSNEDPMSLNRIGNLTLWVIIQAYPMYQSWYVSFLHQFVHTRTHKHYIPQWLTKHMVFQHGQIYLIVMHFRPQHDQM